MRTITRTLVAAVHWLLRAALPLLHSTMCELLEHLQITRVQSFKELHSITRSVRTTMLVQLAPPRPIHGKPRSLCRVDVPGSRRRVNTRRLGLQFLQFLFGDLWF